ncbi:MAG: transcriptional regulator [Rhodoferax sp.]|nr:transcriptional regulator [Rhodoferax sp.]
MAEVKIIEESHKISDKRGNGKLRREVWVDEVTRKITHYNLAYINHNIHVGDNGRVVGYDNAHDRHHRHYFGAVEPVEFVSFEDTEKRFEQDWIAIKDNQ